MGTRTKTCPICGEHFSYDVSQGTDRVYCSAGCREVRKRELRDKRFAAYPKCKTHGCNNRASRVSYGLCETCYYRLRRTGTVDKKIPAYRYVTGAGYIKLKIPDHPLADSNGNVFEHRKIMYDASGNGDKNCYWCGKEIGWGELVIDHLDENKQNNDVDNLVISCNDCNRARGAMSSFIQNMRSESLELFFMQVRFINGQSK